jgi:hypothetical protein
MLSDPAPAPVQQAPTPAAEGSLFQPLFDPAVAPVPTPAEVEAKAAQDKEKAAGTFFGIISSEPDTLNIVVQIMNGALTLHDRAGASWVVAL